MTTEQIAQRLYELCNKGDFEKAQKELFAMDAVSIEPQESPGFEKETKGLEAILEKGKKFNSMVQQVHSCTVTEPVIARNAFAVALNMDVTMKNGNRSPMSEICVYEVKDGKIMSERFFI
jgi:ketosteroid isomerase-like protein